MSSKLDLTKLKAKVAPDLVQVLSDPKAGDEPFAVVYQVKGEGGKSVPPASSMDGIVSTILNKAMSKAAAAKSCRHNVFRNLGSFVVLGDAKLHRELLKQPQVQAAVLNSQSSSAHAQGSSMGRNKRPLPTESE